MHTNIHQPSGTVIQIFKDEGEVDRLIKQLQRLKTVIHLQYPRANIMFREGRITQEEKIEIENHAQEYLDDLVTRGLL